MSPLRPSSLRPSARRDGGRGPNRCDGGRCVGARHENWELKWSCGGIPLWVVRPWMHGPTTCWNQSALDALHSTAGTCSHTADDNATGDRTEMGGCVSPVSATLRA